MVFRIFDHVWATGVDAIFSFSVLLLQKNEHTLLNLSFDQILEFLKTSLLDCYMVSTTIFCIPPTDDWAGRRRVGRWRGGTNSH